MTRTAVSTSDATNGDGGINTSVDDVTAPPGVVRVTLPDVAPDGTVNEAVVVVADDAT